METIVYELQGPVGILTLSREKQLNALNVQLLHELDEALSGIEADESLRCLIITGAGEKAFAAGADIAAMQNMTPQEAKEFSLLGSGIFARIEALAIPVIAAVNGYALGGGCELALCCDLRVASENAAFGQPEVTLGILPGFGGSQRLTRLLGAGRAKELLYTGGRITAAQALAWGLVNRVVPAGQALGEAILLAQAIAQNPPMAVRACKKAAGFAAEQSLKEGLAYETELFVRCFEGGEPKTYMGRFLNRPRKPQGGERHGS